MIRPTFSVALAAALCGLIAGAALAGDAGTGPAATAKQKHKPNAPADARAVAVTNGRKVDLVQLQAAVSGSADWKKVLGALKAGKQASASFPHDDNCRYDLHGTFADGQALDASDVDVCAQKTLNLTD
jgi:hypothetical protein